MAKRVIDFKDIDYLRTELMYIRAMLSDEKADSRLTDLIDFVEEAMVDPDRDTRNEIKRDVYQKIKQAKDQDEANAWHKVYKQVDQVYRTDVNERVNVRPHYGR